MSKREKQPKMIDPNDYPSLLIVILSFFIFPLGIIYYFRTDPSMTYARKAYLYVSLASMFIYGLIILSNIV